MIQESPDSMSNPQNLRITFYLSLAVAHLLFGLLHPESIVVAVSGLAFFTALVLVHVRPGTQTKASRFHK